MKLVFDTNVVMDVLARREPFFETSKLSMLIAARDGVVGAITANTITDLFFLYRKHQPDTFKRKEILRRLMSALDVLDTTHSLCLLAIESRMTDFEDALLAETARLWSADCIVTRNIRDFIESPIEAITPDELLRRLNG